MSKMREVGDVVMTSLGLGTVHRVDGWGRNVVLTVHFDPPILWECGCGIPHTIENYIVGINSVTDVPTE